MNRKMVFDIPEEIIHILDILNKNGFSAYIVGGCVRDILLGQTPKDWDITTDAKPEDVKRFFPRVFETGINHGTVTAVINDTNYEITTFRTSTYEETSTLTEDLSLRDFTINAIAYHPQEGIIDPFSGISDLEKSTIRAVGNPHDRFEEDPLRMLRAVRFSSTLGFKIDDSVLSSIKENCSKIEKVSVERIRDELSKILTSDRPEEFVTLRETGLLKHILPEFDICFDITQNHPYHIYNVAMHTLRTVSSIEKNTALRWTMLLHDTGKAVTKTTDNKGIDHFYGHQKKSMDIAKRVLERYKFDNATTQKILILIKYHDMRINPDNKSVRKAVSKMGEDIFPDLLKVQKADKSGQNPEYFDEGTAILNKIQEIYLDIKKNNQCLTIKDLAINGDDLLAMGFEQGRDMGVVLKMLLNAVLENPELNTKEKLMELADDLENSFYK
ncbi:MAG TPA: CCA tRNA nucleotidyltransferase [Acetivibrio sp.]|nr:CCA tRNA nucleotidyltransferase [Acetivibrio sp.]HPT91941.1 CCA tRNA nucleotidyltransferase [Acetivibrio sp.]HQA57681.1 CCA tRNA nucleotidyltransferase [Acetivibrio sp.]